MAIVRVNPQGVVPQAGAIEQQALQNQMAMLGGQRQMVGAINQDLNQVTNYLDRMNILNQLGVPQATQPQAQTQQVTDEMIDEVLASGGLVDEQKMAEFEQDTAKLADPDVSPEVMVTELEKRKQKLRAQGRDSKDTEELIQLASVAPQQAKLAIGNINQMIQNKAVRNFMARDPEAARSFLQGIGVTGMGGQQGNVQFGAQQTIKDSQGNLFTVTQKRDPMSGRVETAYAPVGDAPSEPVGKVEVVGSYGLTSSETVGFEGEKSETKSLQSEIGKRKADVRTKLSYAESNLPNVKETTAKLRNLNEKATFTLAGRTLDAVMRETGMEPRENAVARAQGIALINQQVLPKLREMLGPAFTEKEGERVLALYGDPNASPAERNAALDALLFSAEQEIARLKRERDILEGKEPQETQQTPTQTETQSGKSAAQRLLEAKQKAGVQ